MLKEQLINPFKVGDRVIFAPDQHAIGRSWSSFDRSKLKPGEEGVVTRIEHDSYLFLDDERGGFHWECFQRANLTPRISAKASRPGVSVMTEAEIEAAEEEALAWARKCSCS